MQDVRTLPFGEGNEGRISLDDLAREGALRMIAAALGAEVEQYVASFVDERDEDGKRLVVRNGKKAAGEAVTVALRKFRRIEALASATPKAAAATTPPRVRLSARATIR